MNNKKALRMAVTLAIINMPLLAQAADVSPVRITDGSTYTMTADSVINTGSNTTGIFVGYKDGGTIVGDNVTVTSDGYGIQIQTYATGGVVLRIAKVNLVTGTQDSSTLSSIINCPVV